MWRCAYCQSPIIVQVQEVKYRLDKDLQHTQVWSNEVEYYHCERCGQVSVEISGIAEWQEAQSE